MELLIFGALAYYTLKKNPNHYGSLIDVYTGKPIPQIKNPYNPVELGFENQLNRRLPHTYMPNYMISDMNDKVGLPIVNPLPGADRISETNRRTGLNLPKHQKKHREILDVIYNSNEYWRFDPWAGIVIPEKIRPRDSSVAYRF